ncbi:uncharacterized protein LOC134280863 isoform X2 [Saccostrea cucullata]|uniref:uncharacterized protein LOC134280863 isoform X2 n=1 Tax=Saccostrea cuccullata TaxID=36930 RepID=UPI002ED5708B
MYSFLFTANPSSQQQRFKLRLDKKDLQQSVPESLSKNAADDRETQEKMETVDDEGHAIQASNSGQISYQHNTNIITTSSHEPQGATSPESLVDVKKENKDIPEPNNSSISGNLQIDTKNVSEYPDKKITMTDFAGQCSYYASHQIFLSPRAFFILVLNMEKKFDDKVGEEVCCQEDSVYGGWTHRDYLEFWMKSIHQYSSDEAPVILVGTHCENKTEKEKALFFREVWKTLDMKKKSLQKHIDVKRQFAVGFHDNESIEKLKLSIADVVCKLDHWGEELPQSWAMFETFFREERINKILSRGKLESFNETLPEGIKLNAIEDVDAMLQFFHDIREIMNFNQQFLNEVIILDVQWFADAFKNVITDKNHVKEDLFEFASEWDKFNETGELDEPLLSAIWQMNNNGYIEHKNVIMLYMEKLGLLAKMSDKTWYVPCMNKMQFPVHCFTSYPASSILCYTFDVLPVEIFHRLVATCIQIPWDIFSDEDRGCIYQTAAIFQFHDQYHNIMLGMTQTEIQTNQSNPSTSTASGQDLQGRSRFAKLGMATNDVLNQAYRDILESEVPPSDIESKVNSLSNKERKNLKLNPDQEDLLKKAKNTGYKEFDISFTYKMIRNICSTIPKPTKGKWGEEPTAGEVTVGDDIERIRFIRNRLAAHVSSASTPQKEFNDTWSMMSDICQRLEAFTGKKYLAELNNIKILTLKREDEESIIQKLNMEHHEMLKTLMSDMQEMKLDVKDIKKAVMKPENTGAMNNA